jgi:1-acyl-sn-glycerol-3-phosphate acyltransferase
MLRIIKIAWLSFWICIATLVLFFPITVSALLSSTGNLPFTLSRIWARTVLLATGTRTVIRGREKIRKGQSYIIISNHQSHFDILALVTSLRIQFRWVIKRELLKIPLFGYALYASRNIFIDRSDREQSMKSIHDGMDRLPPGAGVMFFAEGTRSPDGTIQQFKKGGFIIAMERNLPVLPVTVNGSRAVLPKGSIDYHAGRIEVVVGDPIDTGGYTQDGLHKLIDDTRSVIISNFNPDYPAG